MSKQVVVSEIEVFPAIPHIKTASSVAFPTYFAPWKHNEKFTAFERDASKWRLIGFFPTIAAANKWARENKVTAAIDTCKPYGFLVFENMRLRDMGFSIV